MRYLLLVLCLWVAMPPNVLAADQQAADLFARYSDRIFQIRIIDLAADKKSALGSGFLIAENGIVATNYHVISLFIEKPDKYRIEAIDKQGNKQGAELLDIDVINDLALLRIVDQAQENSLEPFAFPEEMPAQGEQIFSLGNPLDIGLTVVPGTYNGIDKKSYYRRIHFSGSINPGMSGGPVLNDSGNVVGINVSTAGNQISFLIPADALEKLLAEWRDRGEPVENFDQRIGQQLTDNQQRMMDTFLSKDWPTQPLGDAVILAEVEPFVKCWGGSSDEKALYRQIVSSCKSNEHVYLGSRLTTGIMGFQFFWAEAGELNTSQFYTYYQNLFGRFQPDNFAGKDDVGNFVCEQTFLKPSVQSEEGHKSKGVFCVRGYRKYAELYDVLYLNGTVDKGDYAFVSHFTLSGVSRENAVAFQQRFLEIVRSQGGRALEAQEDES